MAKLSNKTYKDYSYLSRYSIFPNYYNETDKKYQSGLTAYLSENTVYTLHTVRQGETLDTLALDYYNNPTLYWVICSFNRIQDPFIELRTGQKIKIPSIANIEFDVEGRY